MDQARRTYCACAHALPPYAVKGGGEILPPHVTVASYTGASNPRNRAVGEPQAVLETREIKVRKASGFEILPKPEAPSRTYLPKKSLAAGLIMSGFHMGSNVSWAFTVSTPSIERASVSTCS